MGRSHVSDAGQTYVFEPNSGPPSGFWSSKIFSGLALRKNGPPPSLPPSPPTNAEDVSIPNDDMMALTPSITMPLMNAAPHHYIYRGHLGTTPSGFWGMSGR